MIESGTLFGLAREEWWTLYLAIVSSVSCAVLGCFLVLRRMALLGDAIAHAILPGLALAFFWTESRDVVPMAIGALGVGVLTAFLSSALNRWGKVPEDAAMGVVFSSLFAVGVLLITLVARNVDLDPGCVLYGLIEFAPYDDVVISGTRIPKAAITLSVCLCIVVAFVSVFFKELKIVSFDPYLATTLGIPAALFHYALMTLVAGTAVASFEAVGSILVVAMIVAPAACAYLLTDRLAPMLVASVSIASLSALIGYLLAIRWNTSVAGMLSVTAGAFFLSAAIFSPRHGLLTKSLRLSSLALRVAQEDLLGVLYREHEKGEVSVSEMQLRQGVRKRGTFRLALMLLRRRGYVVLLADSRYGLTSRGIEAGTELIRSHRLWESYLTGELGLPADHVHEPSERVEHFISDEVAREIAGSLTGYLDPHGRTIPKTR